MKKGLLIGINYEGTDSQLNGCINDQENLCVFLSEKKFLSRNELTCMDDHKGGCLYPTRKNILQQFDSLVNFANKHKDKDVYLFLSYSGHGSYTKDFNKDEKDGKDEVLCPVDYTQSGMIKDDLIKQRLIDRLHRRVKLMILMDCCHSGTIVDLKYNYLTSNIDNYVVHSKARENQCKVIMISGCKDNQTSADAYIKDGPYYEYQGAMTASFLANYSDSISYRVLITKMRDWLKKGNYKQIPQLSTSFEIDIDDRLILEKYD